jgi:hypothetical protein
VVRRGVAVMMVGGGKILATGTFSDDARKNKSQDRSVGDTFSSEWKQKKKSPLQFRYQVHPLCPAAAAHHFSTAGQTTVER